MAVKTFAVGELVTASDANTYLANSGLVFVGEFTASGTSRALVCDNIFTSTYENYCVILRLNSTISTNACFYQYIDTGGTTLNTGYYGTSYQQDYASGTTGFLGTLSATTVQYIGYLPNRGAGASMLNASFDIFAPNLSTIATAITGTQVGISSGAYFAGGQIMGQMTNTTAHRGIRIDNGGGGTLEGKVTIYGYRKA